MKTAAADVGIAVSDGAEIAREIADIIIGSDDLYGLVTLKSWAMRWSGGYTGITPQLWQSA